MPADLIGYAYAATVAAGGVMGYVSRGSVPSLGAGLLFGSLLGYGAYLSSGSPPKPLLQLGTTFALAVMMGARWQGNMNKLMPGGVICLMSCAMLVRGLMEHHTRLPVIGK
ncbi:transmembrane protein 14 homolog [Ctenocephalides felis]|uniref:transmembrane protein 14 homolog n=1 Tax=Ctenocephalides felis TaxID=7515 RepID=UPI000E6E35DE|nr:transmembrane protein 14 homolog [Ctenocephalides felis]XP_026477367.1 transmembrane protein 14 homolog [Ctenocephalides felis]